MFSSSLVPRLRLETPKLQGLRPCPLSPQSWTRAHGQPGATEPLGIDPDTDSDPDPDRSN